MAFPNKHDYHPHPASAQQWSGSGDFFDIQGIDLSECVCEVFERDGIMLKTDTWITLWLQTSRHSDPI